MEGRIKELMHKAFWDVLDSSLHEDPPDYTHALRLLKEIKEVLFIICLRLFPGFVHALATALASVYHINRFLNE